MFFKHLYEILLHYNLLKELLQSIVISLELLSKLCINFFYGDFLINLFIILTEFYNIRHIKLNKFYLVAESVNKIEPVTLAAEYFVENFQENLSRTGRDKY